MKVARTFGLALLGLLLAAPSGFAAVLDFTAPVTVAHGGDWPDIDQDGSGGLHLSYLKGDGVHHLRYSGGAWGGDELVPGTWEASQTGRWNPPRVTGHGVQAHILWGEYSFNNNNLHVHSRQAGTWSHQTITGWIEYSDLQLDARGAVHVVYFDLQGEMGMYHWAFQGGQPVVVRQQVAEGDYRYPVLTQGPGNQIQMATRFRHLHSATMYSSYAWSEMATCGDIGGDSAGTPSIDVGPGGETQTAWTVWSS